MAVNRGVGVEEGKVIKRDSPSFKDALRGLL